MAETTPSKVFSKDEVAKHNQEDDLWLIVDRKVFNLSDYVKNHPGGFAILSYGGKVNFFKSDLTCFFFQDASTALRNVTSHKMVWNFIRKKLDENCIGKIG